MGKLIHTFSTTHCIVKNPSIGSLKALILRIPNQSDDKNMKYLPNWINRELKKLCVSSKPTRREAKTRSVFQIQHVESSK